MIMKMEPVRWSEEKQLQFQTQLTGIFGEDAWPMAPIKRNTRDYPCILPFKFVSSQIKIECKYAVWLQFEQRKWHMERDQRTLCDLMLTLAQWLNTVAPHAPSLLVHDLEYWELSLRSYLTETHQLHVYYRRHLRANQAYRQYVREDSCITLFRQLYRIIADTYDDRLPLEKDIWDMRTLGIAVDLTKSQNFLNFTPITQP